MGAANALSKGIIKGAKELFKKKPKVADSYKGKPKTTPKKDKTAAEALGKGQRPTPKQVEQSNLPNKPKVKATVRSQAARKAAAARAKPGVGKKDIETGKYGGTSAGARAKTAAKNVKTRVKRNPGKVAAATATGAVGTAALLQDKPKVTQASPKKLPDIKMQSPKPKKAKGPSQKERMEESYSDMDKRLKYQKMLREAKADAAKRAKIKNTEWVNPNTGKPMGGVLRDSSGKAVRDSSGKPVRTGYSKGGAVKKPKGYMCGGHAKKKMASGGAVSKPKGCGCAKRGYGKAIK